MAAPVSQQNNVAQSLDTLYGVDGTGRIKLGIGGFTLTGLTPEGAGHAVGTHIAGAALATGDLVVLAGVHDLTSGDVVPLSLDAAGNIPVAGAVTITSGTIDVDTVTTLPDVTIAALPADASREPTTFKSFSGTVITSETTIWTPGTGKKFRLMGFVITQGVATGDITIRDNTAGTTILTIPATPTGQPLAVSLGRIGLLSGAINRVLTAQGVSTETISGYVYGTEE